MFALWATAASASQTGWSLAQRDFFLAAIMVIILLIGTWAIFRIMWAAARES